VVQPDDRPVPNPALEWLGQLLRRVQTATAAIPTLDSPTSAIGPGPAWTGTKANSVHDTELAPVARPFSQALGALAGDVQAEVNKTPKTVPASIAKMMRMQYYNDR